MREEAQHKLDELVAAVADGRAVDWDVVESSAPDEEARASIRRLRAIAAIGQAHTELSFSDSTSESIRSVLQGVNDFSTPASWGPLRILERVGRGRFGDVYRAWDPTLDREVALKLLRHLDSDADSDREVIEEGRLMARVRHPNVVTIHGAQRIDGRTGLWMEFVRGRTLEAELRDRGPFAAEEIARIGSELCHALSAVHDAGLVHRDVKAQNVLRESSGRIVLGDFGTGYQCDDEDRPKALAGTPAYLAPEIFGGAVADARSDVYALGVLLFRLASGRYPVQGRSLRDLRTAHARHERVALETVCPDIPRALRVAIERAIDASPLERYQTAAAMQAALRDALGGSDAPAQTSLRRRIGIAALVVLVAAGSASAFLNNWRSNRKTSGSAEAARRYEPVKESPARPPDSRSNDTPPAANTPEDPSNAPALEVAGETFQPSLPIGKPLPPRVLRQVAGRDFPSMGPVSSDGRLVAFTDQDGALALLDIASGKRWRITESQAPLRPVPHRFSRDGSQILYAIARGPTSPAGSTRAEIRTQPVKGGASTLVWQAPDTGPLLLFNTAGSDEMVLAGRRGPTGVELLLISTISGQIVASRVVQPAVSAATLSPDGRFVAYDFVDPDSGLRDIDLWNVETNATSSLIRDDSSDRRPLWTHDGRHLLFVSGRSGSIDLWAQRVEDGKAVGVPIRLEPNIGDAAPGGLTQDGTLFFVRIAGTQNLYLADLGRTLVSSGNLRRASGSATSQTLHGTWSPNGQQLAFVRRLDDRWSIVVRSLANGLEKEFFQGVYPIAQLRWETTGASLLFISSHPRAGGIKRLEVESGGVTTVLEPPNPVAVRALAEHGIVLSRLAPGIGFELIRKDTETGAESVFQRGRLVPTQIEVSHRGDQLAYFFEGAIRVLDVAQPNRLKDIFITPTGSLAVNALAWSGDDRELIVSRPVTTTGGPISANSMLDQVLTLWAVDVATGTWRALSEPLGPISGVATSPDGRQIAVTAGFEYSELWALENATASLTR